MSKTWTREELSKVTPEQFKALTIEEQSELKSQAMAFKVQAQQES